MANPCTWTYSGDDYGTFDTTCGEAFCMIDGTPKENTYRYCPSCGGPLVEVYPCEHYFESWNDTCRYCGERKPSQSDAAAKPDSSNSGGAERCPGCGDPDCSRDGKCV